MFSSISKVRKAFERGGSSEVVRAGRRYLADAIAPGGYHVTPTSKRTPRGSARAAGGQPVGSALDVEVATALAWFDARRSNYVALASAAAPYVQPEDVILDIGANIGYFTKVLAEEIGFRGTAHLFEPIPHLADLIPQVLADQAVAFQVHPYGLSDETAEIPIFVAARGNLGWNTIVSQRATSEMEELLIKVKRYVDAGVAQRPQFIKIDVEGAEHRVLAGMMAELAHFSPRPVILCEIGWGSGHPQWDSELREFHRLLDLGYEARSLQGEPVAVEDINRTTDVLFVPVQQPVDPVL